MNATTVLLRSRGDWYGLYRDGELVRQGHESDLDLDDLRELGLLREGVELVSLSARGQQALLTAGGRLPRDLRLDQLTGWLSS